jgi:hypothetical protein
MANSITQTVLYHRCQHTATMHITLRGVSAHGESVATERRAGSDGLITLRDLAMHWRDGADRRTRDPWPGNLR